MQLPHTSAIQQLSPQQQSTQQLQLSPHQNLQLSPQQRMTQLQQLLQQQPTSTEQQQQTFFQP
eukprot:Awhi_evm1s9787